MSTASVGVAAPVGDTTVPGLLSALCSASTSNGSTLTMTLVAAPVAAPATKQCSKRKGTWRCANCFPADDPRKTCPHHRKKSLNFAKSSKGKVVAERKRKRNK